MQVNYAGYAYIFADDAQLRDPKIYVLSFGVVQKYLNNQMLTLERVFQVSTGQAMSLGRPAMQRLIDQQKLSLDQFLEFDEKNQVLFDTDKLSQGILKGVITVEQALPLKTTELQQRLGKFDDADFWSNALATCDLLRRRLHPNPISPILNSATETGSGTLDVRSAAVSEKSPAS